MGFNSVFKGLNRWGLQFSRLLAAELCASAVVMLDTTCSAVVWRVLATHPIRQFPLHFPSLPVRHRVPSHFNWTLLLALLGVTSYLSANAVCCSSLLTASNERSSNGMTWPTWIASGRSSVSVINLFTTGSIISLSKRLPKEHCFLEGFQTLPACPIANSDVWFGWNDTVGENQA